MAKTLALFDDGMATPFAWQRALQRGGLSQPPVVTTEPERLYHAERLIVATHQPLASTFKLFEASSLAEVLSTRITQNKPTLVVGSAVQDRKSTRLNSSHVSISYAVFCLKK